VRAHLDAIRTKIASPNPVDLWAPSPDRLPPFLSLEAPSWGSDPAMSVCGVPHQIETQVRLRAVAGTPDGVEVLLRSARVALGDGATVPLTVAGRTSEIRWERAEFIGVDTDATIPDTNRHPAVGVDTYILTSQPTT